MLYLIFNGRNIVDVTKYVKLCIVLGVETHMESNTNDIKTLVTKSATGDNESCKKLYEHLADKVFAYVHYRVATREQAVDVTQDVFIDLFPALATFVYQSREQFYAFVFVITRRKIARHYANTKSTAKQTFDEVHMSESNSLTSEANPLQLDIRVALQTLDEVARDIVILHHWSLYTLKEIAVLKEMNESAVRVRHHRALKQLAKRLEK